jgi:hypothetical protein
MLQSGQFKDPLSVDLPSGDPVPSEDRMRWQQERTVRMALIESIPGAGPVRTELLADVRTPEPAAEPETTVAAATSGGMP